MASMSKQEVDKRLVYGKFQDAEDRRATLRDKVAHKAVDIAMEDDPLQVINNKTGISTPGAVGIAGILGASLLGFGYLNKETPAAVAPVQTPAATAPVDSDYVVRFFDENYKPIEVERLPPELRKLAK